MNAEPGFRIPDVPSLPLFDPDALCPKCGCSQVAARYKTDPNVRMYAPEWITRTCARCLFRWDEACLSSEYDDDDSDEVAR